MFVPISFVDLPDREIEMFLTQINFREGFPLGLATDFEGRYELFEAGGAGRRRGSRRVSSCLPVVFDLSIVQQNSTEARRVLLYLISRWVW